MKKLLRTLGIIFLIYIFYGIIFYNIIDPDQPIMGGAGILEFSVYLAGITYGSIIILPITIIVLSILIFLRKRRKIIIGDNFLIIFAWLIISLPIFILTYTKFPMELVYGTAFFVTLIYSIIGFYLIELYQGWKQKK